MTHELPCHLCNTYHAEREGCAFRPTTVELVESVIDTPNLDHVIDTILAAGGIDIYALAFALKEIRALLGGKN